MNLKKGIKNISYSMIGQFVTLLLGIFIPRLVIVSYSSEINGLLSSIGQVMTYLALLETGLGSAAIQALYKPIANNDQEEVSAILSATNKSYKKIGYIYFSLVVGCSFVFPFIIKNEMSYWFVWVLFLINGMPGAINFLFQGKLKILLNAEGDGYILTNLSTVVTVLTSILKIILLLMHVNIVFVQLLYCGISLVQMVFIYYYVKKHYPWLDLHHEPNFGALKGRNPAFLHEICGLITNSTDVLLLTIFCDLNAVSIYSIYNMIFNLVYTVVSSINSNIQFILGQAYYKGKKYYSSIIDVYETLYISLATALMFVTFRLVNPFLALYTAGADINYTSNSFAVVFFLVKILHCFKKISITTASISGHFEGTKWHAVWESVINLVVSLIAVNKYGMVGVLFGTVVSFVFRLIVSTIYSNRVILKRSYWHTVKSIIVNTGLVFIAYQLSSGFNWTVQSYVGFFTEAIPLTILILVLFGVGNMLFSYSDFCVAVKFIKAKLKRQKTERR